MQQILAAIGSHPEHNEIDDIAHDPYDWYQVRYFDAPQIQAVEDLGAKVAPLLAIALKRAFRKDFAVELTTIHQTTTSQYKNKALETHAFLAFQTKDKAIHGTLALPTGTTHIWATRLMGESTNDSEAKTLSPLEIMLLSDVAVSLVEAFSSCCQYELQAMPPLAVAHMSTPLKDTDELCVLTFQFKETKAAEDTAQEIILVMPCVQLALTLEGIARPVPPSEGKLADTMRHHVDQVHMIVTAEFGSAQLTLEQAMGLNAGDVLLLDKDLDEPMALKIEDRLVFYGKPAQCDDHYAVMITENAKC